MKNKHDNLSITFQAIIIKWILYFIYKTNKWDIRGTENFERNFSLFDISLRKAQESTQFIRWRNSGLIPVAP